MKTTALATCLALLPALGPHNEVSAQTMTSQKISPSAVETAGARGVVRVIVQVAPPAPTGQEADANPPCVNADCAKLDLANSLLPTEAPLIEMLPGNLILMETTPAGLEVLRKLPQVISVAEDGVSPPNDAGPDIAPEFDAPTVE